MTAQERFIPLSFSRNENNASKSVQIGHFITEALQILRHADNSLFGSNGDQTETIDINDKDDDQSITWKLNLTPTTMTLDTSILTLCGLEKVLELIRINVKPQPPKFKNKRTLYSNLFDLNLFHKITKSAFQLSAIVVVPRLDHAMIQQMNSIQFMRQCIQSFVDCGYAFFLDIPSLMANADMILSTPSAAKEHAVEALLILSICSLMARHAALHQPCVDSATASMLMHSYYRQARMLLEDLFDVHHISVVISMFLLSVFTQGHTYLFSPSRVQSALLTTAIRMALAMDLHKLDTRHDKESDQKERLRRLAWMLLTADYYADWNTTGQTGLVEISDWHVDFPQPLPNEPEPRKIEYFSQHCRMIVMRKLELFKAAYMISLRSPKYLQSGIDRQLFQNYFNTPNAFKLDLAHPKKTPDLESLLLHELYCHTQLSAQLPFLPKYYFTSFIAEEDHARCVDLDNIYQRLRQSPPPPSLETAFYTKEYIPSTETHPMLELYCLVSCLSTLEKYTCILEALASLDPMRCHHNPLYGIIVLSHVALLLQKTRLRHEEISPLCQLILIRIQYLLHQVRTIYADPVILLLERMLARLNVAYKQESPAALSTRTQQLTNSLQNKLNRAQKNVPL